MRALRTVLGVLLALFGLFTVGLAVAGWTVQRHADHGGSFTTRLRPVRTDGYAVLVPDLASILDRHVAARILRPDRVRVTIGATAAPVRLRLVPAPAAGRYLDGVAWTELSGVGFARGDQPVDLTDHPGTNVPAPVAEQSFWANAPSGQSLEWDRSADAHVSLLLARADEQAGFAANVTVAIFPSWLDEMIWLAVFVGASALTVAATLLFWRRASPFALSGDQAAQLATLIADRLAAAPPMGGNGPTARPTSSGTAMMTSRPTSHPIRDLTGELVVLPQPRDPGAESPYVHSAT